MTILLIVGVALVLFGGLVLLRFPDRPGGRIAWQGFEVSSIGGGLPIIVLGVVAIGFASVRGLDGDDGGPGPGGLQGSKTAGAVAGCFRDVRGGELQTIEEGSAGVEVVRPDQPKANPVWLAVTDGGTTIGGVLFRFFPASSIFKVQRVVDARCESLDPVANIDRGGDPRLLQNWDTVRLRFGGALYDLRLGGGSDIQANFTRVQG